VPLPYLLCAWIRGKTCHSASTSANKRLSPGADRYSLFLWVVWSSCVALCPFLLTLLRYSRLYRLARDLGAFSRTQLACAGCSSLLCDLGALGVGKAFRPCRPSQLSECLRCRVLFHVSILLIGKQDVNRNQRGELRLLRST